MGVSPRRPPFRGPGGRPRARPCAQPVHPHEGQGLGHQFPKPALLLHPWPPALSPPGLVSSSLVGKTQWQLCRPQGLMSKLAMELRAWDHVPAPPSPSAGDVMRRPSPAGAFPRQLLPSAGRAGGSRKVPRGTRKGRIWERLLSSVKSVKPLRWTGPTRGWPHAHAPWSPGRRPGSASGDRSFWPSEPCP